MEHISVVISGFGPYPDLRVNPAEAVPDALADVSSSGHRSLGSQFDVDVDVRAVHLPISFKRAWPILERTLESFKPDIVIATGIKHASRGISLERCATNHVDSRRRDALNVAPESGPIDPVGPAAFWTRLPLRAILARFAAHGIASTLSSDAGTYVCNAVFYDLLKWASAQPKVLAGFVSFPVVSGSDDDHHLLTLDQQVKAGRDVVEQTVRYWLDPPSEGALPDISR